MDLKNIILGVLVILGFIIAFLQLLSVYFAKRIKEIANGKHSIILKSCPMFANMNLSSFWNESEKIYKKTKDPDIKRYIEYYWLLRFAFFIYFCAFAIYAFFII